MEEGARASKDGNPDLNRYDGTSQANAYLRGMQYAANHPGTEPDVPSLRKQNEHPFSPSDDGPAIGTPDPSPATEEEAQRRLEEQVHKHRQDGVPIPDDFAQGFEQRWGHRFEWPMRWPHEQAVPGDKAEEGEGPDGEEYEPPEVAGD
jgi:hypothetical protein